MDDRAPPAAPGFTTSALFFIFLNMLWIFGVIWLHWGLGAVAILGVGLNHLITMLDDHLNRHDQGV